MCCVGVALVLAGMLCLAERALQACKFGRELPSQGFLPPTLPVCNTGTAADMYEPGSGQGLLADFQPLTNFRLKHQASGACTAAFAAECLSVSTAVCVQRWHLCRRIPFWP